MLDLTETISPKGIRLFDLVKAIGSIDEDDFIDLAEGPFLLQVPLEGQGDLIPEAQPADGDAGTRSFDSERIAALDPTGTITISRSSVMKLQRSSNVEDAVIHLVLSRGGGNKASVGRADDCDLVLAEGTVSKKHALISQALGRYTVTDLGSHNGTFIDGKRLEPNQAVAIDGLQNVWFSSYRAVFLLPEQLHKLASNLRKKKRA